MEKRDLLISGFLFLIFAIFCSFTNSLPLHLSGEYGNTTHASVMYTIVKSALLDVVETIFFFLSILFFVLAYFRKK